MSVWHYTPWGYLTYEKPKDRNQYIAQAIVGGLLPPIAGYHNARDSIAWMDDYTRNRGLSYGNIRYPSLTVGYSGVSSGTSSLRYVSKNVESLYDDGSYKPRKHYHDVMFG